MGIELGLTIVDSSPSVAPVDTTKCLTIVDSEKCIKMTSTSNEPCIQITGDSPSIDVVADDTYDNGDTGCNTITDVPILKVLTINGVDVVIDDVVPDSLDSPETSHFFNDDIGRTLVKSYDEVVINIENYNSSLEYKCQWTSLENLTTNSCTTPSTYLINNNDGTLTLTLQDELDGYKFHIWIYAEDVSNKKCVSDAGYITFLTKIQSKGLRVDMMDNSINYVISNDITIITYTPTTQYKVKKILLKHPNLPTIEVPNKGLGVQDDKINIIVDYIDDDIDLAKLNQETYLEILVGVTSKYKYEKESSLLLTVVAENGNYFYKGSSFSSQNGVSSYLFYGNSTDFSNRYRVSGYPTSIAFLIIPIGSGKSVTASVGGIYYESTVPAGVNYYQSIATDVNGSSSVSTSYYQPTADYYGATFKAVFTTEYITRDGREYPIGMTATLSTNTVPDYVANIGESVWVWIKVWS